MQFGRINKRLSIWVEEDQIQAAINAYGGRIHSAVREALRVGSVSLAPESLYISGPLGVPRPGAMFKLPVLTNKEAINALNFFKEFVPTQI